MGSDGAVHAALGQKVVDDPPGAAAHLLGGLEAQVDGAAQLRLRLFEHGRCAQQHGGMPVMPAGVHDALVFGLEGHLSLLRDGQRVHVRADGQPAAALLSLAAYQLAHHAVVRQAHMGDAQMAQLPADHPRGALLLKGQLRVGVKIPPQGDDVLLVLFGQRCKIHVFRLLFARRRAKIILMIQ